MSDPSNGALRPEVQELFDRYQREQALRQREKETKRSRATIIAYARLAVFAAGVALAWLASETDAIGWAWVLLPLALFLYLMARHDRVSREMRRFERAERFYRRGLARLTDRWAGEGATGAEFLKEDHPYARDLDLFGEGSLYQLLATTRSSWGAAVLADWLLDPAEPSLIRARQQAVVELAPRLPLREAVAVEEAADAGVDPEALSRWASAPDSLGSQGLRVAVKLLGPANLLLLVAWLGGPLHRAWFFTSLFLSLLVAMWLRPRVAAVLGAIEKPARDLNVLSVLLSRLEAEPFESELLVELGGALAKDEKPASARIASLSRLVDLLDARRNQLFAPMAALLLWGTQFAFALEIWRRRSGSDVPRWLEAVGRFDALLALSAYAHEHPRDGWPEITEERVIVEAKALGHPLIPEARLVRNDFRLGEERRLIVVSGSNMSGKSTLLRTIGINLVLAFAGAPVRAERLLCCPLQLGASIRIQDSLKDGISHFYAEILRLRQIMELASGESTVLFLLDEILHGTNSHDRRIGAEAVVRGLVERGAIGLITTHDLALARVAEAMAEKAANVHFVDSIEEGKIRFDYRMREGIVTKSNALELMRSVGLEV